MLKAFELLNLSDDVVLEMKQSLFDRIRTLAEHNLEMAWGLYFREKAMSGFTPQVNELNTRGYVRLFQLFGFKRTEQIRQLLKDLKN